MQVLAYAKARGQPNTWSEDDQGYITRWCGFRKMEGLDKYNTPHILRLALIVTFTILNITLFLCVLQFTPQCYRTVMTAYRSWEVGEKSTLWGAVLVMILFCSFFVWSFGEYVHNLHHGLSASHHASGCSAARNDYVVFCIINTTFIPALLFLELVFAICMPKDQALLRSAGVCPRTCCSVFHTLALWSTLASIQILTMFAIPIGLTMIYAPARTISTCAMLATAILSLVLIVAHVIEFCSYFTAKRTLPIQWKAKILQLFVTLSLLTLINVFLMIYIFLLRGVGEGFQNLVLSLLPSTVLSTVVWYAKRRFSRSHQHGDSDLEPLLANTQKNN